MSSRTLIRSLSTQAAEGYTAPSAGAFVDVGKSKYVEFSFDPGGSVAGSPTSVTLAIWYKLSDGSRLVASYKTIVAADAAAPASEIVDVEASEFYVTVISFDGGSTPTLTLDVYARPRLREDGRP